MEKLPLDNADTIKWLGISMTGIIAWLTRWIFGNFCRVQQEQGEKLEEMGKELSEVRVFIAGLKVDLASIHEIKEHLSRLNVDQAFRQHVERKTKTHTKKIKRLQKKL